MAISYCTPEIVKGILFNFLVIAWGTLLVVYLLRNIWLCGKNLLDRFLQLLWILSFANSAYLMYVLWTYYRLLPDPIEEIKKDLFINIATATWTTDLISQHVTMIVFFLVEAYRYRISIVSAIAHILLATPWALNLASANWNMKLRKLYKTPEIKNTRRTAGWIRWLYVIIFLVETYKYVKIWNEWLVDHCWVENVHTESRTTPVTVFTNQVVLLQYFVFQCWAWDTLPLQSWPFRFLIHTITFHDVGMALPFYFAYREWALDKYVADVAIPTDKQSKKQK